ncbi:MAG: transcriptional repressor LexA [Bacillota bacterium]|nr:transcriptional repressor LexA [Bacillota bacterium]
MAKKVGEKQDAIMNFIKKYHAGKGYPPTIREICAAVGLSSTSTVHGHLKRLEKRGLIHIDPSKLRAIEIMQDPLIASARSVKLPVLGRVAAGMPILAVENIEEYLAVPSHISKGGNEFVLRVKGQSMKDAGILDGDYIVVQPSTAAQNGDIVVALLEDEATVKRFYKEKDHIRLQPENAGMKPIIVNDVQLIGKVTGVFRKL